MFNRNLLKLLWDNAKNILLLVIFGGICLTTLTVIDETVIKHQVKVNAIDTSTSIYQSTCGDINSSGEILITQDVYGQNTCLNIHDTHDVIIDCQNHQMTATPIQWYEAIIVVKNVQNFTIKNCIINPGLLTSNTHKAGIYIEGGNYGILNNNKIIDSSIEGKNSDNIDISNNNFEASGIKLIYSSNSNIRNNTIVAHSDEMYASIISIDYGNYNSITDNYIDGSWEGTTIYPNLGADDGIAIRGQSYATVSRNTIKNVWDSGIETTGFNQYSNISNNQIDTTGICGIGGWYFLSFLGNTVDSNIVNNSSTLFNFFRIYDLQPDEDYLYFKDNIFSNNVLTNQKIYAALPIQPNTSSAIDFRNLPSSISPNQTKFENNVFTNNSFGYNSRAPFFSPPNLVIDGGNNNCWPADDINRPLFCGMPTCNSCNADINRDGNVSLSDYSTLIHPCYGESYERSNYNGFRCENADITGDYRIDSLDLMCLTSQYSNTCTTPLPKL